MADGTTPLRPGSMTVPPWAGWEEILALLGVTVAVAVCLCLVALAGVTAHRRSEWQAWLDARSTGRGEAAGDPAEDAPQPAGLGRR